MKPITYLIFLLFSLTAFAGAGSVKEEYSKAYSEYQKQISKGDYPAALLHAKKAYELGADLYGEESKNYAALAYNYAHTLIKVHDNKEARVVLGKALKLYRKLYGTDAIELVDPLMDLGHASAEIGNSEYQARQYYRALSIVKKQRGEKSLLYAQLNLEAGTKILRHSQTKDSKQFLKKAYETYFELLGEHHEQTALAAFYLGKFELADSKYQRAEKLFSDALATFEKPQKPSTKMELATHAFLVEVYERMGKRDIATAHCQAIGRMKPWEPNQEQKPIFKVPPKYPNSAWSMGIEGETVLSFTISESGMVSDPQIAVSSGNKQLDQAAQEALKQWRYAPRFENGKPVKTENSKARIIFRFQE